MSKFTKTQIKLIEAAKKHGYAHVCFGYYTRQTNRTFGHRDIDAANKLVKMGVFEKTNSYSHTQYLIGGTSMHCFYSNFKLLQDI